MRCLYPQSANSIEAAVVHTERAERSLLLLLTGADLALARFRRNKVQEHPSYRGLIIAVRRTGSRNSARPAAQLPAERNPAVLAHGPVSRVVRASESEAHWQFRRRVGCAARVACPRGSNLLRFRVFRIGRADRSRRLEQSDLGDRGETSQPTR